MSLDDAVKVVRELGFPVAVAAFVLWRLEARLRELTQAINAMTVRCALGPGPATVEAWRRHQAPPPDPSLPGG